MYRLIRAAWVGIMLATASAPACAQAVLVSSVPAPGAKVSVGDFAFHLQFNGLIDHERSRLTLMHPDGSAEHLVIAEAGPPQELSSIARLTEGAYVLHWAAMQVGGHITSGSLNFTATGH